MDPFAYTNTSPNYQPDSYIHSCPHCPRMFASPHNVAQHCREQHGYAGVQCPQCFQNFARNWTMYRHMWTEHGINIHPGQGRPRRGVGRRGPARVHPQESPQPPRVVGEVIVIPDNDDDDEDIADAVYNSFYQGMDAEQAFESMGNHQFSNQSMAAEQLFDETTNDLILDPTLPDQAFDPSLLDQIFCPACPAIFDDQEDLLGHLHLTHGAPYRDDCECIECVASRIAGAFANGSPHVLAFPVKSVSETISLEADSQVDVGTDVDDDSGIGDTSIQVSPTDQPFFTNDDAPRPASGPQLEGGEGLHLFESSDFNAGIDQDFDFLDPDLEEWWEEVGGQFGAPQGWDDALLQF